MKDMPNRALIVIGAALVLGIGGGIAVAQIPSSDGTITACMTQPAGTIRLINAEAEAPARRREEGHLERGRASPAPTVRAATR